MIEYTFFDGAHRSTEYIDFDCAYDWEREKEAIKERNSKLNVYYDIVTVLEYVENNVNVDWVSNDIKNIIAKLYDEIGDETIFIKF